MYFVARLGVFRRSHYVELCGTFRPSKKVNCFSGLPSSVSNAPHLSFFQN